MIKSFIFEKFKGYDRAILWLEQVTTLIGSNASGKSNAIEGIQILSELSTGRDLNVIFDGTKNSEGTIRGGAKGCCRYGSSSFLLGCTLSYNERYDLLYRICIGAAGRISVEKEELYLVKKSQTDAQNGTVIFKAFTNNSGSGDITVEYNNGKRGKNPECKAIRSMSVLSQMQSRLPSDIEKYAKTIKTIQYVQTTLSNMFVLEPIPSLMRGYSRIGDSVLRRNCSNISAVLASIQENSPDDWQKFCDIIESLPENEIQGISFVKTTINDVIRCIAVLAAVISEPEHSLIAIEELDNGIHPSRIIKLIKSLCEIAQRRKIDLVLTTHNVTVLNGLSKEDVLGVSVVYRDKETQASRIVPFVEIENQAGILASGGIGTAMESERLLDEIKNEKEIVPFDF